MLIVTIVLASARPQAPPFSGNPFFGGNQGFQNPQQQGGQFFPNQGGFPNQNQIGQGFPNQGGFSNQGGIPNQGGFSNQGAPGQGFPNQFGGQNQGFANQGGFPNQGGFSNQGGFPSQGGIPNQGGQSQGFPNQFGGQNQGNFRPNPSNPFLPQNQQNSQNIPNMQSMQNLQSTSPNPSITTDGTQGIVDQVFGRPNQNGRPNPSGQFMNPTQVQVMGTTPAAAPSQSPAFLRCTREECQTTNEYNPVCGSDQNQYSNIRKLDCANLCGRRLMPNWRGK